MSATHQLIEEYQPDRIIVEPTGLGKVTDVMTALLSVEKDTDIKWIFQLRSSILYDSNSTNRCLGNSFLIRSAR